MSQRTGIYHVEPLRTPEEIEEMKWAIRRGNKGTPKHPALAARDELLFLIGINTGLRVNDLVRLRVRDVKDRKPIPIREGKTNKRRDIHVEMIRDEIVPFVEGKHSSDANYTMSMFQQFVDPFEIYRNKDYKKAKNKPVSKYKRKSNIKHLFNIYTLYKARASDLELLCKLRNYDLKGMRNNMLFVYHYFMMHIHRNEQVAFYHTLNLNDRFIDHGA